MKKILLGFVMLLTVGASAQLTFVKKISATDLLGPMEHEIGTSYIDNNKYLIVDKGGKEYDIVDSDFNLYKTINLDTTGWSALGYRTNEMLFSDHLYNSDDKVEIMYTIGYSDANNNYEWVIVKTVIIDEDGVVLQTINDVSVQSDGLFQLKTKTYFKARNNNRERLIYETAGTIPCSTCSSSTTANKKAPEKVYDITLYPNPTASTITLAINTDKTNMLVHIYSMDGKLVKTTNVVNGNNLIDTSALSAGTYIYNVQTDTEVIHASQFVKK